MRLRKLDPIEDRGGFVDAYLWELDAPQWFKAADKVFGPPTLEDFIEASKEENRATFGVFDDHLIGLFILTLRGKGLLEVDFMAKPRCDPDRILMAGLQFRDQVFGDLQAREVYLWTQKKNFPTRRLCARIGFQDSGMRLIKGTYRNRVIEWLHLSLTRDAWEAEMLKATEMNNRASDREWVACSGDVFCCICREPLNGKIRKGSENETTCYRCLEASLMNVAHKALDEANGHLQLSDN